MKTQLPIIKEELNPRWEFDCGHCKLSWCCGPTCACGNDAMHQSFDKNPKQCWHAVRIKGQNARLKDRFGKRYENSDLTEYRGYFIAEVNSINPSRGQQIKFRLGNRSGTKGQIKATTKWYDGKVTSKTNRYKGKTWGFYIITIECQEKIG